MTRWISLLVLMIIVAMSISTAYAHEAHRKDMTDAEMAEMKQAAQKVHDGATGASADEANSADATSSEMSADIHSEMMATNRQDAAFSLTDFLGRLHPALVHFPIALFLAAGLAELILVARPASGLEPTVRFLVYTGAAGGILAALLGWLAAGFRLSDRSETLGLHRWTGTAIALAGVSAAIVTYRAKPGRILLRFILAGLAVALLLQHYWGAEMSLGPNHMGM